MALYHRAYTVGLRWIHCHDKMTSQWHLCVHAQCYKVAAWLLRCGPATRHIITDLPTHNDGSL